MSDWITRMTITIGINGFGRIGRCTLAHIAESGRNDVQVVAMNATGPIETNAHLLKYDSVHGRFPGLVKVDGNTMDLGRGPIRVMSTYNPEELDWEGVDIVLECTGKFNEREKAAVGVLISMEPPTKPMKKEAADAGFYHSDFQDTRHPRIQILTIEELLNGAQVDLPRLAFMPSQDATFKKAPKAKGKKKDNEKLDL